MINYCGCQRLLGNIVDRKHRMERKKNKKKKRITICRSMVIHVKPEDLKPISINRFVKFCCVSWKKEWKRKTKKSPWSQWVWSDERHYVFFYKQFVFNLLPFRCNLSYYNAMQLANLQVHFFLLHFYRFYCVHRVQFIQCTFDGASNINVKWI